MRYRVVHRTTYRYAEPAALSQNELCLVPRATERQTCDRSGLEIVPGPSVLDQRTDFHGNTMHHFMVQEPHQALVIAAESTVTVSPGGPPPRSTPPWEVVRDRVRRHAPGEDLEAYPFAISSPFVPLSPELAAYAAPSFPPGKPVLEGAMELTGRIFSEFSYEKGATDVGTPLVEVLDARKGVCQDFAHLAIGCLRSVGLAARYISGYLETRPPAGKPKLVGADASHAWLALFVPEAGWIELDPTNNLIPGERHILLAWGRDYGDVTPVKGVIWGGGEHQLSVEVDVIPL